MRSMGSPELDEDVDLDPERRRYILDAYAQLDRINHYALLGINRAADAKAVKAAYFRLAGLVHPERCGAEDDVRDAGTERREQAGRQSRAKSGDGRALRALGGGRRVLATRRRRQAGRRRSSRSPGQCPDQVGGQVEGVTVCR